jgi:hypothetical protein
VSGPVRLVPVISTRELRLSCMGGAHKQNGRRVAPTAVLVSMAEGLSGRFGSSPNGYKPESGGALLEALQ